MQIFSETRTTRTKLKSTAVICCDTRKILCAKFIQSRQTAGNNSGWLIRTLTLVTLCHRRRWKTAIKTLVSGFSLPAAFFSYPARKKSPILRLATADSCFALLGARQRCVAKICNASQRANAHKLQKTRCYIKFVL